MAEEVEARIDAVLGMAAYRGSPSEELAKVRLSLAASFFPQVLEAAEKRLGDSTGRGSGVGEEVAGALRAVQAEPRASDGRISLRQLSEGLPLRMQKELLGCVTPLSKGEYAPAPQDLRGWWSNVERVVGSLGPDIVLSRLDESHIVHLGPIILG